MEGELTRKSGVLHCNFGDSEGMSGPFFGMVVTGANAFSSSVEEDREVSCRVFSGGRGAVIQEGDTVGIVLQLRANGAIVARRLF